jgi:hypothetical protein
MPFSNTRCSTTRAADCTSTGTPRLIAARAGAPRLEVHASASLARAGELQPRVVDVQEALEAERVHQRVDRLGVEEEAQVLAIERQRRACGSASSR